MTRNARIALLLAAVAVAVAAVVVIGLGGDDDGDEPPPVATTAPTRPEPPPVPEIRLRGGEPVGGARTLEFEGGERVRFVVSSDARQEVHVHGYDVTRVVPAGGRTTFSLAAGPQGVFEIESHDTGREIGRLRVAP